MDQVLKQSRRVQELVSEVQKISRETLVLGSILFFWVLGLKKTGLLQIFDECVQNFRRKARFELFFRAFPDGLQGGFSIKLMCNELLGFTKAKKLARARIFDDEERAAISLLTTDPQISSKFWRRRGHNLKAIIIGITEPSSTIAKTFVIPPADMAGAKRF